MRATKLLLGVAALALVIPLVGCAPGVGPAGPEGATGSQGADGADGADGATGPQGPQGLQGATGETGPRGATGATGPQGPAGSGQGTPGPAGPAGAVGPQGPGGALGPQGPAGTAGTNGTQGIQGVQGVQGIPGPVGPMGSGESALFYALMPSDNPFLVFPGSSVEFPQDGPTTTTGITRLGPSLFLLAVTGVYRVTFQVPVQEPGQLVIVRNLSPLAYTVTGRFTGTSSISLTTLVDATAGDVIEVQNPASGSIALTVVPFSGGNEPGSATLLIELVKGA